MLQTQLATIRLSSVMQTNRRTFLSAIAAALAWRPKLRAAQVPEVPILLTVYLRPAVIAIAENIESDILASFPQVATS
jgi:hypothetical protein